MWNANVANRGIRPRNGKNPFVAFTPYKLFPFPTSCAMRGVGFSLPLSFFLFLLLPRWWWLTLIMSGRSVGSLVGFIVRLGRGKAFFGGLLFGPTLRNEASFNDGVLLNGQTNHLQDLQDLRDRLVASLFLSTYRCFIHHFTLLDSRKTASPITSRNVLVWQRVAEWRLEME